MVSSIRKPPDHQEFLITCVHVCIVKFLVTKFSKMYSLEFLQAINDWQRGGDTKQKARRSKRLKELAVQIDMRFRSCDTVCYRQIALPKGGVWNLLAENRLDETISAWTTDILFAKGFKGGVPPKGQGWQGVIFSLKPEVSNVILNLNTVYADPNFQEAVEYYKTKINGFAKGIGAYQNTQSEVIIELEQLDLAQVHALGGYSLSSDSQDFAERYLSHLPVEEGKFLVEQNLAKSGKQFGPTWIEGEAVARVLERMQPHIERLRHVKKMQDAEKDDA